MEFGDGTANVTDVNPVHQFTTSGIFGITLSITDRDGDTALYALPTNITVFDINSDLDGDGLSTVYIL